MSIETDSMHIHSHAVVCCTYEHTPVTECMVGTLSALNSASEGEGLWVLSHPDTVCVHMH